MPQKRASRWLAPVKILLPDSVSAEYKRCTRSASPLTQLEQDAVNIACNKIGNSATAPIHAYTQEVPYPVYKDANKALRDDEDLDVHGGFIHVLKKAVKAQGQKQGWFRGTVSRGMQLNEEALEEYRLLTPGSSFLWAGFVSTSTKTCFEGNINFEIAVNTEGGPAGAWALQIDNLSDFPDEGEVLIYPYTGFSVVNVSEQPNGLHVRLKTCDRATIDPKSAMEMIVKKQNLRQASRSFVIGPETRLPIIAGNIKSNKHGSTLLRGEPRMDAAYNNAQIRDGEAVRILEVNPPPGAFALVQDARGRNGWILTRNLHVQLAGKTLPESFDLKPGTFVLQRGQQVVCGNSRWATGGTRARHEPNSAKGSNFVDGALRDGQSVMVMELASHDGSPGGFDWALVHRMNGIRVGWVKTRNLHVQLI